MSIFPFVNKIGNRDGLLMLENRVDQLCQVGFFSSEERYISYFKLLYASYYFDLSEDFIRLQKKINNGDIPLEAEDDEARLMAYVLFAELGFVVN
jgi:hypothetical protein